MTKSSKAHYECCHEAGHAVLRFLRGDTLLSIRVDLHPDGEEANPRPGPRGSTDSRAKERECSCGGYVRNHAPEVDPTGTGSAISLNANCKDCTDSIVTHLASIYAAAQATKVLVPALHDKRDVQFDDAAVEDLFRQLRFPPIVKRQLVNRAKALAIDTVVREQKAIRELANILEASGGKLTGDEAAEIIRRNLVSTTLIG
jgi:hypothetical protein